MLLGVSNQERTEFVSKEDTAENKTKFILKPISKRFMLGISAASLGNMEKLFDRSFDFFKAGIAEIHNVSIDGVIKNILEHEINDHVFEMFDLKVLSDLFSKIMEFNKFTDTEKKS
jgi:hypothetical protein